MQTKIGYSVLYFQILTGCFGYEKINSELTLECYGVLSSQNISQRIPVNSLITPELYIYDTCTNNLD